MNTQTTYFNEKLRTLRRFTKPESDFRFVQFFLIHPVYRIVHIVSFIILVVHLGSLRSYKGSCRILQDPTWDPVQNDVWSYTEINLESCRGSYSKMLGSFTGSMQDFLLRKFFCHCFVGLTKIQTRSWDYLTRILFLFCHDFIYGFHDLCLAYSCQGIAMTLTGTQKSCNWGGGGRYSYICVHSL